MDKLELVIDELALFDTVKVIANVIDEKLDTLENAITQNSRCFRDDITELKHLVWATENLISAYVSKIQNIAESKDK